MKNPVQLTEAIDPIQNSLRPSPWRCRALIMPLAFGIACFAISPTARAVDPPPDGGYQNQNTAEGDDALFALDLNLGPGNTAIGWHALFDTRDGQENAACGAAALEFNSGSFNTGIGTNAAVNNAADYNTALGYSALYSGLDFFYVTGGNNTASGAFSLASNLSGADNTASGFKALFSNTDGSFNTASGVNALFANSTGNNNVANGFQALYSNTIGLGNTANGVQALFTNTTGGGNTANGVNALYNNTTGSSNIALGVSAGFNLSTGNNNIDIGNFGVAGESKRIRIGTPGTQNNTYIAGIYGVTVSRGIGVIVDSTGHLGTTTSSARFKDNIKPMDKASEAILALKPVTFRYKPELDPEGIPQFGLVAEQVEKVNPDLVARDEEGKPYTVRYEAVNAMLLNEFLKEHRKVESLEKEMKALSTALQKVSNELELMKAAPRVVANDQ